MEVNYSKPKAKRWQLPKSLAILRAMWKIWSALFKSPSWYIGTKIICEFPQKINTGFADFGKIVGTLKNGYLSNNEIDSKAESIIRDFSVSFF